MRPVVDLTGQLFGRWKVIKRAENNKRGRAAWLCECQCEKRTRRPIDGGNLRSGNSKSCGCVSERSLIDLTGKTFGRWNVLGRSDRKSSSVTFWLCECQCEKKTRKPINGAGLRSGKSKSCGCLRIELQRKNVMLNGEEITRDEFASRIGLKTSTVSSYLQAGKTPEEIMHFVSAKSSPENFIASVIELARKGYNPRMYQ